MKCIQCKVEDYVICKEKCFFCDEEECGTCENGFVSVRYCPVCDKEDLDEIKTI